MPIEKPNNPVILPLSKKQKMVLSFIVFYFIENNCCPLSREINVACNTGGSPSQILSALHTKGYIICAKGKMRGIQLLDSAFAVLNKGDIEKWHGNKEAKQ